MGQRYYAVGKTTWEAMQVETGDGYVGPKRRLVDIKRFEHGADEILATLLSDPADSFEVRCLPFKWTQLLLARYGLENPDGVEIWSETFVQYFDEAKPGTPGWKHGNRGQPIVYGWVMGLWVIADRFLPELYEPENLREVLGELYAPYIKRRVGILPQEMRSNAISEYELEKMALRYPIPKPETPESSPEVAPQQSTFHKAFDKVAQFISETMPRMK